MALLDIVYAPDPIFKQKAQSVTAFDDALKQLVDDMLETMKFEQAFGLAAPMVGVLQRVAVIDVAENNSSAPLCLINPVITHISDETQTIEEASLSFVGIGAPITRPASIDLTYQDTDGGQHTLEAEGFLSSVIQHEMDYLDGRTYLDHLSRLKRDMLMKKMLKIIKHHPPHRHGAHCNH